MVKVREDMTGWNMWEHGVPESRLTVIKQIEDYIDTKGVHYAMWECKCSCDKHSIIKVRACDLRSGHTMSCGCVQEEHAVKARKRYNKYDNVIYEDCYGKYRVGYAHNTGSPFYIDADDYDILKDVCFDEFIKASGYHSLSGWDKKDKKNKLLCYFIKDKWFDGDVTKICEHADRNTLNNRSYNLRAATYSQNNQNQSIAKNNSSGIVGVRWHTNAQKWHARIFQNGKEISLGLFNRKEDAILARLNAENKYFDNGFETQRHLFEQYGISDGDIEDAV